MKELFYLPDPYFSLFLSFILVSLLYFIYLSLPVVFLSPSVLFYRVWGNEIQRERERERKTRWRVYCEASQRLLVPVGEPGGLHLEAGHRSLGPQGNLSNVGKGAWEESVRISHAMNHNKTLSIYVRCVNPFIL
ncbi:hypothetical protein JOB18_011442 [Solea senegalensis]|uniref:Uncharacterized protein n=1 Tax=Solea senegalensis TaxID=28829 RepID=A0AAV6SDC4_SOLSE|nr:hypothetical protein JOB18_011442 [Solea senegalensis]